MSFYPYIKNKTMKKLEHDYYFNFAGDDMYSVVCCTIEFRIYPLKPMTLKLLFQLRTIIKGGWKDGCIGCFAGSD